MAKPTLIFIHGWGTTWESLYPLISRLKQDYPIHTPNLPYPSDRVLTLDDYCQYILEFIKSHKISRPVLIGHSLGGAISTKIAIDNSTKVSKIVLLSSASVRHSLPSYLKFFQKFSKLLHPIRKPILKLLHLDASDYIILKTDIEKQTFRNLIAADQHATLSQINIPTLILWGNNDQSTPVTDGQTIHRLIPNSIFKSYPSGHFFYLDYPNEVSREIINFLNS